MTKESPRTFNVQLTHDEANTILESLGHMPFMRVYKIIEKIHLQASLAAPAKPVKSKTKAKAKKK